MSLTIGVSFRRDYSNGKLSSPWSTGYLLVSWTPCLILTWSPLREQVCKYTSQFRKEIKTAINKYNCSAERMYVHATAVVIESPSTNCESNRRLAVPVPRCSNRSNPSDSWWPSHRRDPDGTCRVATKGKRRDWSSTSISTKEVPFSLFCPVRGRCPVCWHRAWARTSWRTHSHVYNGNRTMLESLDRPFDLLSEDDEGREAMSKEIEQTLLVQHLHHVFRHAHRLRQRFWVSTHDETEINVKQLSGIS